MKPSFSPHAKMTVSCLLALFLMVASMEIATTPTTPTTADANDASDAKDPTAATRSRRARRRRQDSHATQQAAHFCRLPRAAQRAMRRCRRRTLRDGDVQKAMSPSPSSVACAVHSSPLFRSILASVPVLDLCYRASFCSSSAPIHAGARAPVRSMSPIVAPPPAAESKKPFSRAVGSRTLPETPFFRVSGPWHVPAVQRKSTYVPLNVAEPHKVYWANVFCP